MTDQNKQQQQQEAYQQRVEKLSPQPTLLKNIIWAFVVGGLICTLGQGIQEYFLSTGMDKKEAAGPTAIVLVFLAAILTALGVYDEIGKRAGAGSVVPITGFANSVVSPALEFKREGFIFGVGAKMFVVAGPVLTYGMATAFIIGLVHWIRS